jgi:DNA modification methylase
MSMKTNTVYTGEASEVLSTFDDDCIDLVVTSPPYGNLRTYQGYAFDFQAIARQLYRVTKPGGVVVWVVGDQTDDTGESGESFRQCLALKDLGFRLHDTMIYMKAGPAYPAQDKYFQVFEYMFVFSKGKPLTCNLLKDRENRWFGQKWSKVRTRRETNGDLKSQTWYADVGDKLGVRFNVWQYAVGYGYQGDDYARLHPASFPEALAQDHILTWSNPGDIILDPMAGSGTTLKMAKMLERQYIGIEISSEYVEKIIKPRLAATNVPLGLFSLEAT